MKVAAIARRGIRRDFWDLYEICKRTSLSAVLADYRRKFGIAEDNLYHVIRALTWFDDAERDRAMPRDLTARKWRAVRSWFEQHVPAELVRLSR